MLKTLLEEMLSSMQKLKLNIKYKTVNNKKSKVVKEIKS